MPTPRHNSDIKRMEELLSQHTITPEDASSAAHQLSDKIDYSYPHNEIINFIQSLIQGELADGADEDNLQDKFYTWLSDYKNLHPLDEFNSLVQDLRQRFAGQEESSYKVRLLFEVLDDLTR